jgi:predicted ATPase
MSALIRCAIECGRSTCFGYAAILERTDDRAAAEESYHRALAVARSQTAKTLELRAATSLVRLWRDQGKRIEARDTLAPVYGWFTEGFQHAGSARGQSTPRRVDAVSVLRPRDANGSDRPQIRSAFRQSVKP